MVAERKSSSMKRSIPRTTVKLAMAGLLIAGMSACGGGGGGDSSDNVDLRAAYDRINRECMTYADVDRAVGSEPTSAPNSVDRIWTSDNQRLQVQFRVGESGRYTAGYVSWNLISVRSLEKAFLEECK